MATVERLNEPTPAQVNQGGQKSDPIVYRVAGLEFNVLKGLVLAGVGLPGLPRPGVTPHPDYPKLICRTIRVEPVPNGPGTISRAYADFTTTNFPGAGLLHSAVDVYGEQFVLSSQTQDVEVQIPVVRLKRYAASAGDAEVEITAWAVELEKVTETRTVLRARWGIQGRAISVYEMDAMAQESNKLHTIAGRDYLFRGGSVTPRDNLTYEISAAWEIDNGTETVNSAAPEFYKLPGDLYYRDPVPGPGLIRDPYNKLISTPAIVPDAPPEDVASWPLLAQVPYAAPGDINNLPGVPNL